MTLSCLLATPMPGRRQAGEIDAVRCDPGTDFGIDRPEARFDFPAIAAAEALPPDQREAAMREANAGGKVTKTVTP